MKKKHLLVFFLGILNCSLTAQTIYPNNEDGQYEDMLTPAYYNTPKGGVFRNELNKFIHFARKIPFQHPLQDSVGLSPKYSIRRSFGDGIGPGGTGSHHPAIDYHIVNASTSIDMYAAFDGLVAINKNADRYRHYLSITTDIQDSSGTVIGKMLALYGHVDLDLDSIANLNLDGQAVKKGDLVSKNLYSGTVGGPHLHFEIRYYRTTDTGTEDFYGGPIGGKTSPSSGSWTYGFWNPNEGYGFAHPLNHLNSGTVGVSESIFTKHFKVFPNPTTDLVTIEFGNPSESKFLTIVDITGREIFRKKFAENEIVKINLQDYERGVYLVIVSDNHCRFTKKIVKA